MGAGLCLLRERGRYGRRAALQIRQAEGSFIYEGERVGIAGRAAGDTLKAVRQLPSSANAKRCSAWPQIRKVYAEARSEQKKHDKEQAGMFTKMLQTGELL